MLIRNNFIVKDNSGVCRGVAKVQYLAQDTVIELGNLCAVKGKCAAVMTCDGIEMREHAGAFISLGRAATVKDVAVIDRDYGVELMIDYGNAEMFRNFYDNYTFNESNTAETHCEPSANIAEPECVDETDSLNDTDVINENSVSDTADEEIINYANEVNCGYETFTQMNNSGKSTVDTGECSTETPFTDSVFSSEKGAKYDKGNTFYNAIAPQLIKLLSTNEHCKELENKIRDSRWVKINYDGRDYYVVGIIYDDEIPEFICYGVPAKPDGEPPAELLQCSEYMPVTKQRGYYVMYQSAITGEILQP